MKRKTGWAEAITHALECEGRVNIGDLAAAIPPGPGQLSAIDALVEAARAEVSARTARLDPDALESGTVVLVAVP